MTGPPEVLAIGETMVLVAPADAESLESAVDFRLDPGGAEANVASHLVALGHPAAWVGAVGDDALGRRLCTQLAARGVDVSYVPVDPGAPTGLYVKDPGAGVLYYRAGSAASRMDETLLQRIPSLRDVRLVHLTGITPALSPSCLELVRAVFYDADTYGTLVSFDVNHRPALWPAGQAPDRLRALADRSYIVFVGQDEAETLWGATTPEAVRDLLPNPAYVVIKEGPVGATEIGVDGSWHEPAPTVEVVEVVGAGDAFAGGYLAALLEDADSAERLRRGHERAGIVLGATSDFPREPAEHCAPTNLYGHRAEP